MVRRQGLCHDWNPQGEFVDPDLQWPTPPENPGLHQAHLPQPQASLEVRHARYCPARCPVPRLGREGPPRVHIQAGAAWDQIRQGAGRLENNTINLRRGGVQLLWYTTVIPKGHLCLREEGGPAACIRTDRHSGRLGLRIQRKSWLNWIVHMQVVPILPGLIRRFLCHLEALVFVPSY